MANCVCRGSEIRVGKGPAAVKRKVQVLVAIEERAIRVVQEVIAREAELKLFVLRRSESEILEQRHVRIKESRARQ